LHQAKLTTRSIADHHGQVTLNAASATGGYYTVAVILTGVGMYATAVVFEDGYLKPQAGVCGIRFGHLSPDTPPVSVYVNGKVDLPEVIYTHRLPKGSPPLVKAGQAEVAVSYYGSFALNSTEACFSGAYETIWVVGIVGETGDKALKLITKTDYTPAI
jgi:hypothetical protein